MSSITLKNVEKWFGETQVIRGIDLEIKEGEMVVFVGPSGCGKSTLLRMIAGLEDVTTGQIFLGEQEVTDKVPSERELAMVFQSYALYPHMNVADNMGFALKTSGASSEQINQQVAHASEILELDSYLQRRPKELSGGQRQRVAIGRAIVREPKGFLFDEPLSNLDAALRVQMRFEIAKLHEKLGATMIYVTHDQVEAMTLADKIVVLNKGQVEQVGTPRALYETPESLFVAQFIGSPKMNLLAGTGQPDGFLLSNGAHIQPKRERVLSSATQCGVRAEHIQLVSAEADCEGVVELYEYLGADSYIYVNCREVGMVTVRILDQSVYQVGQQVKLKLDRNSIYFFDETGKAV